MPRTIGLSADALDLSKRFNISTTVVASPSGATETIIANVSVPGDMTIASGIILTGWAAYTVGTSGASGRLRIRQTNVTGTVVGDTGALTGNHGAGVLVADDCEGFDTAPVLVYALTLTIGSGVAASTVSAVMLRAIAV